jgi:hypothetical protein
MLPAAIVRALLNPAFTAAEFTPTQWDSAEDKAKFANALMKFHRQRVPPPELHEIALPPPEQHVRAYNAHG